MGRLGGALFCAFLLSLILACSNSKKTYVIGVSQCSEDNWREKLNGELRDATYLHDNVELRFVSADDNDKQQTEQINALTDGDVDLLIVSPNQMNTVTKPIDRAYDKGIPVILFDRKTSSGKYTAFIGADNEKIGRTIGEYVATQLGGRGTVAEIRGLEGSSPAIERHSSDVAAGMFAKGVVPDYIFAQNDRMALGAWSEAKRRGLDKKIRFVGIDALPGNDGGIKLVRDGVLEASYIYPTRGDLVMHLALNILEGKPYQRDNYMKAALVTRDNAETMLMQTEEMGYLSGQLEKLHGRIDFFFTQYSHQKVYFTLSVVILVLVAVVLAALYRMAIVKRRMERETADAKLSFFTDMSHDLRTPLTLIADPVERILDDSNLTSRQRDMLAVVRRNSALLQRLVSEILDLRRIQEGKMQLTVTEFNLADYMRLWVDGFLTLAATHKVSLTLEAGHALAIKADYYKVERICYNLISNALKYNKPGGTVTVSLTSRDGKAVISVADTGIGMSKANAQHAFEKFFRARQGGGGTGVGLAIVKAFAELHGGSVSVNSVEGEGSKFVVELPLSPADTLPSQTDTLPSPHEGREPDTQRQGKEWTGSVNVDIDDTLKASQMQSPGEGGDGLARPIILVVDDNADVRQYVAGILADSYDVRQAADGKEGLDIALKDVPDLIVCDVMMPVMDGLEMCRHVKRETATSHVPVVLLTSNAQENQRAEGYDCGADAYITKPFSSKVLLSRVRNLLENRKRLKYIYGTAADAQEPEPADADSRFMADFRRVVGEHIADSSMSVETISTALGLSRVQMYRKVKQLTGQSPVEIIRITRLKRAEHLLKTTNRTVSEISYDVGFSSPSYFSKCFKDHFGRQPGENRN